jgi:uncharacterized protein YfbU (UPF0304 family)
MKLNPTDVERLIIRNQYKILQLLEPRRGKHDEQWLSRRNIIEVLELGIHEGGFNLSDELKSAIPEDRVEFALEVCDVVEDRDMPFYGFQDKRLNDVAKYWGTDIEEGEPPSDDEYRAMLAEYESWPKKTRRQLSEHQQV